MAYPGAALMQQAFHDKSIQVGTTMPTDVSEPEAAHIHGNDADDTAATESQTQHPTFDDKVFAQHDIFLDGSTC